MNNNLLKKLNITEINVDNKTYYIKRTGIGNLTTVTFYNAIGTRIFNYNLYSIGLCSIQIMQSISLPGITPLDTIRSLLKVESKRIGSLNIITFQNNHTQNYKRFLDAGFVEIGRFSSSYGPDAQSILMPFYSTRQKNAHKKTVKILSKLLANGETLQSDTKNNENLTSTDIEFILKSNLNKSVKLKLLNNV